MLQPRGRPMNGRLVPSQRESPAPIGTGLLGARSVTNSTSGDHPGRRDRQNARFRGGSSANNRHIYFRNRSTDFPPRKKGAKWMRLYNHDTTNRKRHARPRSRRFCMAGGAGRRASYPLERFAGELERTR